MQGAGAPEGQAKAGSEQPAQAGGSRGGVLRDPRREGVDEAPPGGAADPRGCAHTLSHPPSQGHRTPHPNLHLTAAHPANRGKASPAATEQTKDL